MKKIISLLLVLSMIIFAFASCGGNKDDEGDKGGNNNNNTTPTTENATIEGFLSDMETAVKNLVAMKKGTITVEENSHITLPEALLEQAGDEIAIPDTVTTKITLTFDESSLRAYGEVKGLEALVGMDISFDVIYVNETLYISVPAADVAFVIKDLTAEDIQDVIDAAVEVLNEELESVMEDLADSGLDKDAIDATIVNTIVDALKSIDLTQCKDAEDIVKEVIVKLLPVAAEVIYGENWEEIMKKDFDSVEDFAEFVWENLEEVIPQEVLGIINSDAVIGFLTSDFSEYVDFTKTTDSDITYKLTIKKSLFDEIVKVVKATLLTFDIDVPFEMSIDDIVFTVVLDSNKNLKEVSFNYNVSGSVMEMTMASDLTTKVTVSQTPETVTAPANASDFEELDKDEVLEEVYEIIEDMFGGSKEEGGLGPDHKGGGLDGMVFVFSHVEIELGPDAMEMLAAEGVSEEEFIEANKQEIAALYEDMPLIFDEFDYDFDGYNIYVDGQRIGSFDGKYLIMSVGGNEQMFSLVQIYFTVA